jgi:hypothetical protein
MTKIIIARSYCGFREEQLSDAALERYKEIGGIYSNIRRDCPKLVQVVEEMGERAAPDYGWEVIEIPDDVEWQIEDYDGMEWVAEKHRTWGL